MAKYNSRSEAETKEFARKFAKRTKARIFALYGELGAGKTVFVKGFAEGLGIKENIISPTFVLIKHYQIPQTLKVFYHIDLCRLENTDNLGLEEILINPNNIIIIEWADKLKDLPENAVMVVLTKTGSYSRLISISKGPTV